MKKKIAAILSLCVLVCSSAQARVEIGAVTVNDRNITVAVSTDAADLTATLVADKDGSHNEVVFMADEYKEAVSKIVIAMPDEYPAGVGTSGYYNFNIKSGVETDTERFYYFTPADRDVFLEQVKAESSESWFENALTEGTEDYDKLKAAGFNVQDVDDAEKATVINAFMNAKDAAAASELAELFTTELVKVEIGMGNDVSDSIAALNPSYGDVAYNDIEDPALKDFIADYVGNQEIQDTADIAEAYEAANILYEVDNARSSELYDLITANSTALGLDNTSAYSRYLGFSSSDRDKANDAMVIALANDPAEAISDFQAIFVEAVNSIETTANEGSSVTGGGTGLGGGTGGGGGGFVANTNTNIVDWQDLETKEETFVQPEKGPAAGFTDIAEAEWARIPLTALIEKGILSGTGENKIEPNRETLREELVKMVVVAKGGIDETATQAFGDVPAGVWSAPYIATALKNGWVNGVSADAFGLGLAMSRQDSATLIYRVFGDKLVKVRDYEGFTDESEISDYAKPAIIALYEAGIIDGMPGRAYDPNGLCTRAQMAKILYGVIE